MAEISYAIDEGIDLLEGQNGSTKEGEEEVEGHPSVSDILTHPGGYPTDWIVLIIACALFTVVMLVLFIKAVMAHKKYSTKHTMQFLSTMGILFVYPLFGLMYVSGMVVPRANSKCTFIAEMYESMSLMFFLKLMLTYMGGKKNTVKSLEGQKVHLNAPPLCWCPMPSVKFSSTFLLINELFVLQLIVLELVLGYVDLLMSMDKSKSYPAALVEEKYSHVYHGIAMASLVVSVYGLSSIYHSAEHELKRFNIFKKFISYKIVVTMAKVQDIIFTVLSSKGAFGDLSKGAFSTHLRVHMWASTLTILECTLIFPVALRVFPISDYPSDPGNHENNIESPGGGDKERMIKNEEKITRDTINEITTRTEADNTNVKTILFLTDSLLSTFSSSKFCDSLTCSKKGLSRFIDIRKHLSDIQFCDYVIVSAGINDIYKYRMPLDDLIRFSVGFYDECAKSCPRTKFIFLSMLQTNMEWVNNMTDDYNTYIFELSLRYPNLLFYDNYQLVNRDILLEDGIHVSDKAVKFIARSLVKAVTNLSLCFNDPRDPWPLRPSFAKKALTFKSEAFEH